MAIKITIEMQTWIVDALDSLPADAQQAMIACYMRGEKPAIEQHTEVLAPVPVVAPVKALSTWTEQVKDDDAAKRIEAQQATIKASGITLNASEQLYATGTRMADIGYETQRQRKAEHDASQSLVDAAHALVTTIKDEKRLDVDISAGELASKLEVNGKITIYGRQLTEQSIRGLASRLESPMLGYVLGLRNRTLESVRAASSVADSDAEKARVVAFYKERSAEDRRMIAEVLRHECKQNPDVALKLRTRNGQINDVFAVVSPSYVPADAPDVVGQLIDGLPADAKGTHAYDAKSTAWELKASVWTPTPVDEQAVGEAFKGYASLRGRDNGTGRVGGGGGIELLRCLNASVYMAQASDVNRIHRGKVLTDIDAMIEGAIKAISVLCKAWGVARTQEIKLTTEERKQGDKFMSDLFLSLMRGNGELVGVLPGRTDAHAIALVSAYHAERRDPDKLVRADVAQAWTRYIQGQPGDVRASAQAAIGSYLVRGAGLS